MNFQILFLIIVLVIIIYSLIKDIIKGHINKKNNVENILDSKLVYLILFLVVIITSIYKLGKIPNLINADEAGMGYDALSISNYGVDRYLNRFPLYLMNFGSGQSVMLAYLSVLFIKIFGMNLVSIRIPTVLLRIFSFIACYFISRKFDNKMHRFTFLFLFSICPYFIMKSRWGLDCNLLLDFLSIAICIYIYALDSKTKFRYLLFLLSGLFFGLSFYCYILSLIIIPIILFLFILYSLYMKKATIKDMLFFILPIFILAIPFLLLYLVNKGYISEIKGIITIPKLYLFRDKEISFSNITKELYIFKSLLSYDKDPVLVFQSSTYTFGALYYISIPFIIIGFIALVLKVSNSIKYKKYDISFLILVWLISVIFCQLIIEHPNINKANAIFIPLVYLCSLGICTISKYSNARLFIVIFIYIISFCLFINYYFNDYNKDNNINSYFVTCDYSNALSYIEDTEFNNVHIELCDRYKLDYIYFFLYYKINPYLYQVNMGSDFDSLSFNINNKIYDFNVYDIDKPGIYIVRCNEIINKLINSECRYKIVGNYYIFYKE